ncbi:hypothetical protein IWW39_002819 [Coemansia spiralis]|uniref:PB1 domain-containing protein n=2 Tax=Coemansia TaxID=4863 RepID=A0A9W8L458_9FUNG|nr:hypothetical protein IWW39_002819 [Coemansia spiralis]
MALKVQLEQWHQAVEMFDEQNYSGALDMFRSIADSAKIHFNIGLILGRKGDHDGAIEAYDQALKLDQYLVVAYFQRGVAKMIQQRNPEAMEDFNSALKFLRDNEFIDYTQIGLNFKVYTCEVLYNRALCHFCMGQEREARTDLFDASKRTAEERHSLIRKAADSSGMDCPLYCVPKGVVYRPSASKLKSTKKIDFLGSAKVIASADGKDNFTGFKGALVRKETMKASGSPVSIHHQKSMRVRRTTPPPETNAALARSNTMPAHRHENIQQPMSAMTSSSRMGPSSLQREALSREPGSLPAQAGIHARMANAGYADTPKVEVHMSESDDLGDESEPSSAFTSPATAPSEATTPSTGGMGDYSPAAAPKSALKKGPVDPLDIIRAGLARRTTLKNQGQQGRGEGKPGMPQRSVTMKVPTTRDEDDGRSAGYSRSNGQYPDIRRAESASPRPASNAAQVARNETIVPMIQRANTEGGMQAISTLDYAAAAQPSPEYYENPEPSSYGSRYMPPQHPGLKQASVNPIMMTPPLSHEEAIARGLAAMRVQNSHVAPPMASTPSYSAHHHIQYDSSSATSPSPSMQSPPGQGAGHYGALSGSAISGGALRRAPTKKDAMKVKVHYGEDIINLMVPKMASYDSLRSKLAAKLSSAHGVSANAALRIRYLDEDGEAVLMTDEDDYELAKAYAGGDMSTPESNVVERLELWCSV